MRTLRSNNRGAALVEFAIVTLLLFTLVLGIIEFGMMMKDYLALHQAAREGARSAALGSPVATITSRIVSAGMPSIAIDPADITLKTGPAVNPQTWPDTLGDKSAQENDAATGDLILVSVTYDHPLVTGAFFSWMTGGSNTVTIGANMVMRRE